MRGEPVSGSPTEAEAKEESSDPCVRTQCEEGRLGRGEMAEESWGKVCSSHLWRRRARPEPLASGISGDSGDISGGHASETESVGRAPTDSHVRDLSPASRASTHSRPLTEGAPGRDSWYMDEADDLPVAPRACVSPVLLRPATLEQDTSLGQRYERPEEDSALRSPSAEGRDVPDTGHNGSPVAPFTFFLFFGILSLVKQPTLQKRVPLLSHMIVVYHSIS